MNASLPREPGSGASPIPPLFCLPPSFPSSWVQAEGIASCSLSHPLLNLPTQITAAQKCNTILYDTLSLRGCIIFI
jgi:hypothetical protein